MSILITGSGGIIGRHIVEKLRLLYKKSDIVLNALIRKTQIRLIGSNKQSNDLANEMSALLDQIDSKAPPKKNELKERLKKIKNKITDIQNTSEI